MLPRDLVYVGHMLDMARKAVAKVRSLPRETYDADEKVSADLREARRVAGAARPAHALNQDTPTLLSGG